MIQIIPKPLKVVLGEGAFKFTFSTKVGGDFPKTKKQLVAAFSKSGVEATIVAGDGDINFVADTNLDKEGYILNIKENKMTIKASDEAGAFYCLQTLRQKIKVDIINN